jgi:hypothetical protein
MGNILIIQKWTLDKIKEKMLKKQKNMSNVQVQLFRRREINFIKEGLRHYYIINH